MIVGHSERRALFGETDEALARKVRRRCGAGLLPILCVGETEAEREAERDRGRARAPARRRPRRRRRRRLAELVVAYEPVWAIGTGRTATPEQAQEAIAFVRALARRAATPGAAEAVRILYGGSVKPDNAAELFAQPDIDGGLVGGASLDPGDFAAICEAAA